jgi:hypothetical protein
MNSAILLKILDTAPPVPSRNPYPLGRAIFKNLGWMLWKNLE